MTDRAGIEIDYCPSRRGVWLYGGELDKPIERSAPQAALATPLFAREIHPLVSLTGGGSFAANPGAAAGAE